MIKLHLGFGAFVRFKCLMNCLLSKIDFFLFYFRSLIRDEDALLNTQCPRNLELRWQTEVSSSIYATPLIADINRYSRPFTYKFIVTGGLKNMRRVPQSFNAITLTLGVQPLYLSFIFLVYLFYSDGKLEIVVPSFVHYLEVLEGSDGDKMPGKTCGSYFKSANFSG